MIQIPFLIGAAIGTGITLYMKRKDKEKTLFNTVSDGVKSSVSVVSGAAIVVADTAKSTVETIKEKNAAKEEARTPEEEPVEEPVVETKKISKKVNKSDAKK